MGMKSLKWEEIGTKNLFPHTSSLERGADLHMAQLMPLSPTVSWFNKIQIGFTFLVPAHPGSLGKGPLNVCVQWQISGTRMTYLFLQLCFLNCITCISFAIDGVAWSVDVSFCLSVLCSAHQWALQKGWINPDAVWRGVCGLGRLAWEEGTMR